MRGGTTELSTDAIFGMIGTQGHQQAIASASGQPPPVSTNQDMPQRLYYQQWTSPERFLPGQAGERAAAVNDTINDAVKRVLKEQLLKAAGAPADVTSVLSGITAPLELRPMAPIRQDMEILGLCIAVVTLHPALALACAKALVDGAISGMVSASIQQRPTVSDSFKNALNEIQSLTSSTAELPEETPRTVHDPGQISQQIGGLSEI